MERRYFVLSDKLNNNYCIEFVNEAEAVEYAKKNSKDNTTVEALSFENNICVKDEIIVTNNVQ